MFRFFLVFTRSGVVLYSSGLPDSRGPLVNQFIREVLLERRSMLSQGSLMLRHRLDDERRLVFVVGYQKLLSLSFVDGFLSDMQRAFRQRIQAASLQTLLLASALSSKAASDANVVDFDAEYAAAVATLRRSLSSNIAAEYHKRLQELDKMAELLENLLQVSLSTVSALRTRLLQPSLASPPLDSLDSHSDDSNDLRANRESGEEVIADAPLPNRTLDMNHDSPEEEQLEFLDHLPAPDASKTYSIEGSTSDCEYEVFLSDFGDSNPRVSSGTQEEPLLDLEAEERRIGLSVSLHEELRQAILKKADEHRAQEAKVLHVAEHELASHFLRHEEDGLAGGDDSSGESAANQSDKRSLVGQQPPPQHQEEEGAKEAASAGDDEGSVMPSSLENRMTLGGFLAAAVVQRGKAMHLNQREERFGEDNEEE